MLTRLRSSDLGVFYHSSRTDRASLEPHQDLLRRLYILEGRELRWIVNYMRETHGLNLSLKQYKTNFKKWGYKHNITQLDAAFILRLLNHARSQGREEVVLFSGRPRRREDIIKYIRRNVNIVDESDLLSCISDNDETPQHIKLQAPEVDSEQPTTTQLSSSPQPRSLPALGPLYGAARSIPPSRVPTPTTYSATTTLVEDQAGRNVEAWASAGFEPYTYEAQSSLLLQHGFNAEAPISEDALSVVPAVPHAVPMYDFDTAANGLDTFDQHVYRPMDRGWHQLMGSDMLHSNTDPPSAALQCPHAPTPVRTCPPDSARSDILRSAFPPAVLITEHLRGTSPGLWMTAQPVLQECKTQPDADVLSRCIDLLAWTQISNQLISLAVIFFLRTLVHVSEKFRTAWMVWIACVRIAQILLEEQPFEQHVWQQALRASGEPMEELALVEVLLLTCADLSFVVEPREWEVLTKRLEHVSGSCVQRLETLLSSPVPSADTMSLWEQHKAEIGHLYQLHSLEEVARLMKERHSFGPSIRGYRQRIAEWGLKKRQASSLGRRL